MINEQGVIATDAAALPQNGTVTVALSSGVRVSATMKKLDAAGGLALLQGATSSEEKRVEWKPMRIAKSGLSVGKTVVGIAGRTATRIGTGVVIALPEGQGLGSTTPHIVETNIPGTAVSFGSPLIDANGELQGISTATSRGISESAFLAASSILMHTSGTTDDAGAKKPDENTKDPA